MKEQSRFVFIIYLRALAACLITNSHYEGIYPLKFFANGGLLGDVLFFAVSGYCLWHPATTNKFIFWYGKRFFRIFVPVWLITVIYCLLGIYSITQTNFLCQFLYPTSFHFVGSIIILYIPLFFCMKYWHAKLLHIIAWINLIFLLTYFLFFDKGHYHIDNVHSSMILFLFMQSLLIGAYFRNKPNRIKHKNYHYWKQLLELLLFAGLYVVSKLCFVYDSRLSSYQIFNQYILLVLLFFIFQFFLELETKLPTHPLILRPVSFIADLTLEIYLVQFPIIAFFNTHTSFPLNLLLCTGSIVIAAYLLHILCAFIMKIIPPADSFFLKFKGKNAS